MGVAPERRSMRELDLPMASAASRLPFGFSMTGGAMAATNRINKDEVTIVTATGGVSNVDQEDEQVQFTVSPVTFSQKAGKVVQLAGTR